MIVEKKLPKWHQQQEVILKAWGEASACYRYMHHQSFLKYRQKNMHYSLPVIILSTITGTANFAQESFGPDLKPYVAPGIGGLNLIAGLIATVSQFLKISEYMESHRVAALAYGKFSRQIRLELSLPLKDRTMDGVDLIEQSRAEFDRLLEQSPSIPEKILNEFEYTFKDVTNLYKPEIIDVHPITRFAAIRENNILARLKNILPGDEARKDLIKELEDIRKAGEGVATAPKNLTILKKSLFQKRGFFGCLASASTIEDELETDGREELKEVVVMSDDESSSVNSDDDVDEQAEDEKVEGSDADKGGD